MICADASYTSLASRATAKHLPPTVLIASAKVKYVRHMYLRSPLTQRTTLRHAHRNTNPMPPGFNTYLPVASFGTRFLVRGVRKVHHGAKGRPEERGDHCANAICHHACAYRVSVACGGASGKGGGKATELRRYRIQRYPQRADFLQ